MGKPSDNPKPGRSSQNGAIEIPSTISKDQAETPNRSNARVFDSVIFYGTTISWYECIRYKAAYITRKRYNLPLNSSELLSLVALCGYIQCSKIEIVSLSNYIDFYLHASKTRANLTGTLRGLIAHDCIHLFDQKKNGTRYVGVTEYGEKINSLFLEVIASLYYEYGDSVKVKQERIAYKENERFWQVPNAHELDSLTTLSITTKNKHLFNPAKYV